MAEPIATTATTPQPVADEGALVESELLVEDVSIDGMCGVY
jgi:mycofactocin precursor